METGALSGELLNRVMFPEPYFTSSPEWRVSDAVDDRVDWATRYLESTSGIAVLTFTENKRARTYKKQFSLKRLEKQAYDYCHLYLDSEARMQFVYANAWAGAHVRMWKCERSLENPKPGPQTDDNWKPMWGNPSYGDWNEYKDVGDDVHGTLIMNHVDLMKRFPPTAHIGQTSQTYGGSSQGLVLEHAAQRYSIQQQFSPPQYKVSYSAPSNEKGKEVDMAMGYTQDEVYTEEEDQAGEEEEDQDEYASQFDTQSYTPSQQFRPTGVGSTLADQYEVSFSESSTGKGKEVDVTMGNIQDEEYAAVRDDNGKMQERRVVENEAKAYQYVQVERKSRLLEKDEIVFTDRKGDRRTTKIDDWTKTKYQGERAWTYRHYVSLDREAFKR